MREILFVAGEASGDLHAAGVARELSARGVPYSLAGIGGAEMERAGVQLIERSENLAVMGFAEVIKHLPRHYALLRELTRRIRSGQVALVILIDYPGFNMKLAAAAKAAGVPVLYYIVPQVWAWGAGRLADLARIVTKAAVILPFEEELFRKHGVDATFVGHPLLDRLGTMPNRDDARRQLGLSLEAPVLALFPGSRAQEIARHMAPFTEAAMALRRRHPTLQVVVGAAPGMRIDPTHCPFPVVSHGSSVIMRAADAAICKSGTTTLEAAVTGCPLVVAYRTSAITYAAARRVVTIPRIGLVNVVAGQELAREFVQGALQPSPVADALEPLLDHDSAERRRLIGGLAEVRRLLGEPGAARRVADLALSVVNAPAHV